MLRHGSDPKRQRFLRHTPIGRRPGAAAPRSRRSRADTNAGDQRSLSRKAALAMVFKLARSAEQHWRQLNGSDRLAEIVRGVRFRDGEAVTAAEGTGRCIDLVPQH
jgi:hypothetical protein